MAKRIIITLYKSELLYDVKNKVHLTARSRAHAQEAMQTANMQVNDEEEETNQMLRSLGDAYAKILPKLSPYYQSIPEQKQAPEPCPLKKCESAAPDEIYLADNILMERGRNREFTIPLTMPDNFNEAFIGSVTASFHSSLVNTAIAEWFTLVSPADAAAYYEFAERDMEKARMALHARIKPLKRGLGVF
jgi:hypothetical protein